jgi:hypothetical protein
MDILGIEVKYSVDRKYQIHVCLLPSLQVPTLLLNSVRLEADSLVSLGIAEV